MLSDSTYFIPGVWYTVTQRIHLNTITGSSANADGINEVWVYDDMIFQQDTMRYVAHDTMLVDGIGFRSFQTAGTTTIESSVYIDNMTVWTPIGDSNFDNGTTHSTSYKMVSPIDITDRTVYYDHYVTTETTVSTSGWPSVTSAAHTEAWLFYAGSGNTMTVDFIGQTGGNDYIFIMDGNDADDPILDWEAGFDSDLSNSFGGDGSVTSTGERLYVYTVNSEDTGFTKFQMTSTINIP